nr:EOG090X0POW [Lepidurus arcticus]
MTMDTSLVNKDTGHYSNTTLKQPLAPKRSFDIAFLTGNREESAVEAGNRVPISSSNNPKKASKSFCCSNSVGHSPQPHPPSPHRNHADSGSAFTKVVQKSDFSRASPITANDKLADDDSVVFRTASTPNPFLMAPHLATSLSLQFLQNHSVAAASKGFAMSLFGPAASQLLQTRPYSALFMAAASAGRVLPSSLAALSAGTAQNMCAKCNLSFRMTSDLVYHMRSQHRQDTTKERQRRQEKLRCSVCGESFRERHHLTRHMTSHEDREPVKLVATFN